MTPLIDRVEIDRRFARSARIDADLNGTPPLVGYVLQASVAKALATLAVSQTESRQGAFTWTGPYGGGKSSAALLVANLVAGADPNRAIARELAGDSLAALFGQAFPELTGPWAVVAVTGSRIRLRAAIAEAATSAMGWSSAARRAAEASDDGLIRRLLSDARAARSGVLLVLDELGKMLEQEALEGGDVHLLQDLAEHASRSEGRLVIVGILHQSFEQYAARAARDARQEWAKVQGRFQDIAFLSGADETVALLGRAISSGEPPATARRHAEAVAEAVGRRRPTEVGLLTESLLATWPLNPVTALLLGPVSRQRFAQNERSVFGFLSSAEPAGFQEFVSTATTAETYDPARLWDYLAANFGMALASGPDGSRFSLAFEAIERAGAKGHAIHVALTKAAAVIEFFRNGSGLALADDVFAQALPDTGSAELASAITDLLEWAIFIRQPRLGGYALFAGSDFDLEAAIGKASSPVDAATIAGIPQRVGLGFATAKRHYFSRGALRTFDIVLQLVGEDDDAATAAAAISARRPRGSGSIVLLLSDGSCDKATLGRRCKAAAKALHKVGTVAAIAAVGDSLTLRSAAGELLATEHVLRDHPQLEGDRIARREIAARQSACVNLLHSSLEAALDGATWWLSPDPASSVREPLALVASALADAGFRLTPSVHSELLQRDRLSSNAAAALRELCYAMVRSPNSPQLGIEGFPAELGLYLTTLAPLGLHRVCKNGEIEFHSPDDSEPGRSLQPAWTLFERDAETKLDGLFSAWAAPPYGLKAGVMPVFALAYLMANRDRVAVYIDDVFQTAFNEVFVDKLLQKPGEIRLRRIDRTVREAAFLSGLAARLNVSERNRSLPIAQALYQRFEALPIYAQRTAVVGDRARQIRGVVLKSSDPEALLFDNLPAALGDVLDAEVVYEALLACEQAYPKLLEELRVALAKVLGVDPYTFEGLNERVEIVKGLTNDLSFDAFAMRAAAFETAQGDIEGLVSILLHKPASSWTDRDCAQALTELARYGRRFRELEALAVVRDRRSGTEALALVVGINPSIPPLLQTFELTELEKKKATEMAERVLRSIGADSSSGRVRLAALARAVASLAADQALEEAAA